MKKKPREPVPHPTDPSLFLVPLTRGYFAVISAVDAAVAGRQCWCSHKDGATVYARGKRRRPDGTYECVSLHRAIATEMRLSTAGEIDHINGNGLDCRRSNLRAASHSQNQYNRRKQANNASGFKGVSAMKNGRWRAQLGGQKLGCFATAESAAAAVALARTALHGEFANHGRN